MAARTLAALAGAVALAGLGLGVAGTVAEPEPATAPGTLSATEPLPEPAPEPATVTVTVTVPELADGRPARYWHSRTLRARERVGRLRTAVHRYRELFELGQRIDRRLAARWPDSPLAGYGLAFVREAEMRADPINATAIVSIAGVESTFGREPCRGTGNAWGLGACGRAWSSVVLCGRRWQLAYASTWERGIRMASQLVRCLWPRAETVYDLHGYCAGCPYWPGDVASLMAYLGSGPELRRAGR